MAALCTRNASPRALITCDPPGDMPREWDYSARFQNDFRMVVKLSSSSSSSSNSARGRAPLELLLHQHAAGSRVGSTVWDAAIVMSVWILNQLCEDPRDAPDWTGVDVDAAAAGGGDGSDGGASDDDGRETPLCACWCGKRVVELGSGVGLAALAAACRGAHVLATDQKRMLDILTKNVARNREAVTALGRCVCAACPVAHHLHSSSSNSTRSAPAAVHLGQITAAELSWGQEGRALAVVGANLPFKSQRQAPDIILGADVTYEVDGVPLLVETLQELADFDTDIYITHFERGMEAEELFGEQIARAGFVRVAALRADEIHEAFGTTVARIMHLKKRR